MSAPLLAVVVVVVGNGNRARDPNDAPPLPPVCRPFFDKVTIDLPAAPQPLVITSTGAPTKPYIKSVTVNGRALSAPILTHADIASGGRIEFEMSGTPQAWASGTLVRASFGSYGFRTQLT